MDVVKVRALIEMLKEQGLKSTEFTMDMGRVLMLIASEPGLAQKDILKKLDMPPGNINRLCAALGAGSPKKGGLKLIKGQSSAYDWRSTEYFLSNKGLELIARITNL